jgi:CheY-like chemotaxis protein
MEANKKRIMIIDDDLDNLQLTKDIMQFSGYETYDFLNPVLALDTFKQNPNLYDLVLMDVKMKELDGREAYKEIKQINPHSKVYVFTDMEIDSDEFRKICPSFKEQQLIKKPARVDSLLKVVNEAIAINN